MFVYSIKTSKGKLLGLLAVITVAIILMIIVFSGGADAETASTKSKINTTAGTAAERVQFLNQYGWEVKEEPISVTEVLIPEEFDTTYEDYNTIQKTHGMDLSKYKGKSVKQWAYEITNYPNSKATVQANLLVHNGKVIGGDIHSTEENGFMHGFALDSATSTTVDVLYDVSQDGTIVVQADPGGMSGSGMAGGPTGAGISEAASGATGNGNTNNNANGNNNTNNNNSTNNNNGTNNNNNNTNNNGTSSGVSNPQTGDNWF